MLFLPMSFLSCFSDAEQEYCWADYMMLEKSKSLLLIGSFSLKCPEGYFPPSGQLLGEIGTFLLNVGCNLQQAVHITQKSMTTLEEEVTMGKQLLVNCTFRCMK